MSLINQELVDKANELKQRYPCSTTRIDSTHQHNANIGGAKNSWHIDTEDHKACAIDLAFDTVELMQQAALFAVSQGWTGIELDLTNNHLHLDLRTTPQWHVIKTKNKKYLPLTFPLTPESI